jgi:SAM-dependent MidA family methyltransferase
MNENNLFFQGKKNNNLSVINDHNFYQDYFYKPGFSDITFQVDIKNLFRNFNKLNFSNKFLISQREFLFELGISEILKKLSSSNRPFEEINTNRFAINQLIKPNGMGNYFVSLHSNMNNDFTLKDLDINKSYFDEIPFIEEFPQRFELPGIYKKNKIISEDLIK